MSCASYVLPHTAKVVLDISHTEIILRTVSNAKARISLLCGDSDEVASGAPLVRYLLAALHLNREMVVIDTTNARACAVRRPPQAPGRHHAGFEQPSLFHSEHLFFQFRLCRPMAIRHHLDYCLPRRADETGRREHVACRRAVPDVNSRLARRFPAAMLSHWHIRPISRTSSRVITSHSVRIANDNGSREIVILSSSRRSLPGPPCAAARTTSLRGVPSTRTAVASRMSMRTTGASPAEFRNSAITFGGCVAENEIQRIRLPRRTSNAQEPKNYFSSGSVSAGITPKKSISSVSSYSIFHLQATGRSPFS
jgi:hypothetical protein